MFNQFADWLDSMLAINRRSTWELADWLSQAIDRLDSKPVTLKQPMRDEEIEQARQRATISAIAQPGDRSQIPPRSGTA